MSAENHRGISRSTKVSIGVSIPIACVIVGLAIFVFTRRLQRKRQGQTALHSATQHDAETSETAEDKNSIPLIAEMPGDKTVAAEMPEDNRLVTEMPA
jgi:hypothetical protein